MEGKRNAALHSKPKDHKLEMNLEALRGAAALIVVWSHVVVYSDVLSPSYHIKGWAASEPPARISVFLFFVLSGFVIGISNKQPLKAGAIVTYVKKRFIRIYPIYFIAVVFALLIAKPYPVATVVANLTFLQVAFTNVIWENSPIWSLNYEVLYYLVFIPISFYRFNYSLALSLILGIGVINLWLFPSHTLLSSYSFGLATWVAGLVIARATQNSSAQKTDYKVLVGVILILCSFRYFNVLDTAFLKATRALIGSRMEYVGPRGYREMVNFSDFSYVPYFVLFVLLFTNKKFPYRTLIESILFLLPSITFYYLYKNRNQIDIIPFVQPGFFYLLGLVLIYSPWTYLESISRHVIKVLIKIGSVSYGLYIIHMPLLILIGKTPSFANAATMYLIKLALLLTSSLFLAYLLELKLQPWIRGLFYRPSTAVS